MRNVNAYLLVGIVLLFGLLLGFILLYNPIVYNTMANKLKSETIGKKKNAIEWVASQGRRSLPYIRDWLSSENLHLVSGACESLAEMNDNAWIALLPDILSILKGPPSRITDSAANVLYKNKYACYCQRSTNITADVVYENKLIWLHDFIEIIKCNICIYLLKYGEDEILRLCAAKELGKFNYTFLKYILLQALKIEKNEFVREKIIDSLSNNIDDDVHGLLISRLKKETSDYVIISIIKLLNKNDNNKSNEILFNILKDSKYSSVVKSTAIQLLGNSGDCTILDYLANNYLSSDDFRIRYRVAEALANKSDQRAVPQLISVLKYGYEGDIKLSAYGGGCNSTKMCASWFLGNLKNASAIDALVDTAVNEGNINVQIASIKAIGNIGQSSAIRPLYKLLLSCKLHKLKNCILKTIVKIADQDEIVYFKDNIESNDNYISKAWSAIILHKMKLMPVDFPEIKVKSIRGLNDKQLEIIIAWLKDNLSRLTWDDKENKYFILQRR